MKYILALQLSAAGARAVLFDQNARCTGSAHIIPPRRSLRPGWTETDPQEAFGAVISAAAGAVERAGIIPSDIAALGICSDGVGTAVWNACSGAPVYNIISACCRRTAGFSRRLEREKLGEYILSHTGSPASALSPAAKIKWILDSVPQARTMLKSGELCAGTEESLIIWSLTGGKIHTCSLSCACRTMLFDTATLKWDPFLCSKFGIAPYILPQPRPCGCLYGQVADGIPGGRFLAGIPIFSCVDYSAAVFAGFDCPSSSAAVLFENDSLRFIFSSGEKRAADRQEFSCTVSLCGEGAPQYFLSAETHAGKNDLSAACALADILKNEMGFCLSRFYTSDGSVPMPGTAGDISVICRPVSFAGALGAARIAAAAAGIRFN